MLRSLYIENIAVAKELDVSFHEGFSVLTGETGAGKSVIIDSLNFVLGAKADKSLIRSGQSECVVKAQFNIEKSAEFIDVFNEYSAFLEREIKNAIPNEEEMTQLRTERTTINTLLRALKQVFGIS